MQFVIEPGEMGIEVGVSAYDIRLTDKFRITGKLIDVSKERSLNDELIARSSRQAYSFYGLRYFSKYV